MAKNDISAQEETESGCSRFPFQNEQRRRKKGFISKKSKGQTQNFSLINNLPGRIKCDLFFYLSMAGNGPVCKRKIFWRSLLRKTVNFSLFTKTAKATETSFW